MDEITLIRTRVLAALNSKFPRELLNLGDVRALAEAVREATPGKLSAQSVSAVQPVGTVGRMPGTTGFTMACFSAAVVPEGTKLYVLIAKQADADAVDAKRYRWLRTRDVTFEGEDWTEFVSYIPEIGHDGSNLDAAIDAAMAQSTEGAKG